MQNKNKWNNNKYNKTNLISSLAANNINSSDSDDYDLTNWNNISGFKSHASNNCNSVTTSSNSLTTNLNSIVTTSTPLTTTWNYTPFNTTATIPYSELYKNIISDYLQEKEIDELLEKIINRCNNDENVKQFIQNLIFSKTYSEDFVLKYYSYIMDKTTLKAIYKPFIKSQQYPSLALLLETDEK